MVVIYFHEDAVFCNIKKRGDYLIWQIEMLAEHFCCYV